MAPVTAQSKATQRRARWVALHQQVWVLRDQGWPGHAIATHLGIGTSTVLRYLHTATLPERTRRSGPVAGQITRVKMLKCQMFGRASLALFGRRFVLIPGRMQEPVQRLLEPSEAQARPSAA